MAKSDVRETIAKPEPPDFYQTARQIIGDAVIGSRIDALMMIGLIANQLRQVWNARGAADLEILDAEGFIPTEDMRTREKMYITVGSLDC